MKVSFARKVRTLWFRPESSYVHLIMHFFYVKQCKLSWLLKWCFLVLCFLRMLSCLLCMWLSKMVMFYVGEWILDRILWVCVSSFLGRVCIFCACVCMHLFISKCLENYWRIGSHEKTFIYLYTTLWKRISILETLKHFITEGPQL